MAQAQFDFSKQEDVEAYIENLNVEYRYACYEERRADGCHRLGELLSTIHQQYDKAARVFKLACDQYSFAKSCGAYGNYRLLGKGVEQSSEDALRYHRKGCDLGARDSCFQAGLLCSNGGYKSTDELPLDREEALRFFSRCCDADDAECCFEAMRMSYLLKRPESETFRKAERGCELNHVKACYSFAHFSDKGIGCERNQEVARRAKLKADAIVYELTQAERRGIVYGEPL